MSDIFQSFFQCIKKNVLAVYGEEQKRAFDELKSYLSTPPILLTSVKDGPLFLYLAVSEAVVSAVLFREEAGK